MKIITPRNNKDFYDYLIGKYFQDYLFFNKISSNFAFEKVYLGGPVAPNCTIKKVKSSSPSWVELAFILWYYNEDKLRGNRFNRNNFANHPFSLAHINLIKRYIIKISSDFLTFDDDNELTENSATPTVESSSMQWLITIAEVLGSFPTV